MAAYISRLTESGHLPLTPPDSGSGYAYTSMQYPHPDYASHAIDQSIMQEVAYEYPHTAYMPPVVSSSYSSAYQPSMYQSAAGAAPDATLPSISAAYYEPIGAPVLPPLRIQERMAFNDEYSLRSATHDYPRTAPRPAKEERAVGGVSAKLDYDMDRMISFVASSTQHMYDLHCSPICLADIDITRSFQQNVSSPPAFRKWVHQVLSATRLPSATILLSLHYLSDRLKLFPSSVPISENQIYRLLAVALILGSKFLDDNTFINRSWSDVTAIKVSELNSLEIQWLGLIEYGLHVDRSNVQTWLELWNKFDIDQSRDRQSRLSPLDTSVARHTTVAARPRYSPYPTPYSSSTLSARTFEPTHTPVSSTYHSAAYGVSDPWASAGRPPYEDYYKRSVARYPMLSDFDEANNRRITYEQSRLRDAYHATDQAYPSTSYPVSAITGPVPSWELQSWYGTHRGDCACSHCAYHAWKPYTAAGSYSMGTVMG